MYDEDREWNRIMEEWKEKIEEQRRAQFRCRNCRVWDYGVTERYSFGVYAGKLCESCCSMYRDNCGLDQPQGNYADLDEPYWEE